ncbi:hypothetical protein [Actinokineospora cianjurensis]|uniref:Uncharacterized protein n=1 Tax=Actinokineospora cianjurensis TaxID=585224 RepID=A0A421B3E3_9PSEU|nr:hypothetical protein [Actinokineospora cianjurensis]RLK58874.1 hypothetical protein CLV68_3354 [Actinokineospora cianjurensis]
MDEHGFTGVPPRVVGEIRVVRGQGPVVVPLPVEVNGAAGTLNVHVPADVRDGALLPVGTAPDGPYLLVRVLEVPKMSNRKKIWAAVGGVVLVGAIALGVARAGSTLSSDEAAAPTSSYLPVKTYTLDPTTTRAPVPTTAPPITTVPTTIAPTTVEPRRTLLSEDALKDVKPGSCLANQGTDEAPAMAPAPQCQSGSFKVLNKLVATTDGKACAGQRGYSHAFIVELYNVETYGGVEISRTLSVKDSYVLCLSQR